MVGTCDMCSPVNQFIHSKTIAFFEPKIQIDEQVMQFLTQCHDVLESVDVVTIQFRLEVADK